VASEQGLDLPSLGISRELIGPALPMLELLGRELSGDPLGGLGALGRGGGHSRGSGLAGLGLLSG